MFNFDKLVLITSILAGLSSTVFARGYNYGDGPITKTITRTTVVCPSDTATNTTPTTTKTTTTPTDPTVTADCPLATGALYSNEFDIQFFPTPYIRLNYSPNFQVTSGRGINPRYEGDQYGMITPQASPLEITIYRPLGVPATDPNWYFDVYFLRVACVNTRNECKIRFTGTKIGGGTPVVQDVVYDPNNEQTVGEMLMVGLTDDDMHEPGQGPWSGLEKFTVGLAPGQNLETNARAIVDMFNYLWRGCLFEFTP